ncbi:MAG: hypothetical protein KAW61_04185 [candidate division Zixibacteria bacterium]|nr:hypothetical protein [candidate division Zixibacteria bacterium]
MATTIWHVLYRFTARGKQYLRDMLSTMNDVRLGIQLISYNLGIGKEKPLFGRFSYIEKAEYWALVWGAAIMAVTGLLWWFDNYAVTWVPKGFLDVMLVIHYCEAWLATLAILIWHMYSTVFNPSVYPMNPAWYTGKMPRRMYMHEHPEDPVVKELVQKTHLREMQEGRNQLGPGPDPQPSDAAADPCDHSDTSSDRKSPSD